MAPSDRCSSLLSLLSCARCSPFAGHFVGRPSLLTQKPNITVCESFCFKLYDACVSPLGPTSGEVQLAFCTQRLGLRVGGREPELAPVPPLTLVHSGTARNQQRGVINGDDASNDIKGGATCFAAARTAAVPLRWLSWGVPCLISFMWWHTSTTQLIGRG